MTKELQVSTELNVFSVLESAIQKGIDPDSLTKLVDLQERIAKSANEQAYNKDMAKAQLKMPVIIGTKTNTQTTSKYADLADINSIIRPIYAKHGFSLSFGTAKADYDHHIRITCDVMHEKGHSKPYYFDLPIDTTGIKGSVNKTIIHGSGSTTSYGQRYLVKLIFNLAIEGEDDDGQKAGKDEHDQILIDQGFTLGLQYGMACYKHKEIIESVKGFLEIDDLEAAAEYLYSLTNQELMSIHRAPTKGGIFTLEEKSKMNADKSPEWRAARKVGFELNPDVKRGA